MFRVLMRVSLARPLNTGVIWQRRMLRFLLLALVLLTIAGCNDAASSHTADLQPESPALPTQSNAMSMLGPAVIEEIDVLGCTAFWDSDRMLEIMREDLYALGDRDENAVSDAIASSIDQWQSEQTGWPAMVDCDRPGQAFAELNECGDFREKYENHPDQCQLLGYCHGQQQVVRGGHCFSHLAPATRIAKKTEDPEVGELILQQLTDAGLAVDWDGTFDKRMSIPNFNWQRRTDPEVK